MPEPTPAAATARASVLTLATAALLAVVASRAWVTEDAYITFRTVDNFVTGYGLRWNVDERVQAYTHPLWMLLHIPFYAVFRDAWAVTIGLSLACTAGAWGLVNRHRPTAWAPLVLLVLLAWSHAFVDFATSGLESPLGYLLLAAFWARAELRRDAPDGDVRALTLIAALAAFNRLDTPPLYAPLIAVRAWRARRMGAGRIARDVLVGASPLLAWEAFSLVYYGFPFPNTKYAKLSTGIPARESVEQGLAYAMDLVVRDPASAVVLLGGLLVGATAAWRAYARRGEGAAAGPEAAEELDHALLGAGVAAYAAYVVSVGGDFMAGRFWAVPVLGAALLLHRAATRLPAGAVAALGVVFVAAFPREDGRAAERGTAASGVTDERAFWAETNGIEGYRRGGGVVENKHSRRGLRLREELEAAPAERAAVVETTVGMFGYFAGPAAIIVDKGALADPLLARLPMEDFDGWRIGHFFRFVPRGYVDVRTTGDLSKLHPDLREYYGHLHEVVAGDVWSAARFAEIVRFNFGMYDALLEPYVDGRRKARAAAEAREAAAPAGSPASSDAGGAEASGADGAVGASTAPPAAAGAAASEVEVVPGAGDAREVAIEAAATPFPDHTAWNAPGTFVIPAGGQLELVVSPARAATKMEVSADAKDLYTFAFFDGQRELGRLTLPRVEGRFAGLATRTVDLPDGVGGRALTRVVVTAEGDGRFAIGHLVLR